MRRTRVVLSFVPAVLLATGCAASNLPRSEAAPDRVLAVDSDGRVLRQSTAGDNARVTFAAPMQTVWRALIASYADLGIEPTVSDAAAGRYGSTAFAVPRQVMGRPIGKFFDCGSGLTGAMVDAGRVTATVVTTLASLPDGTTTASTRVTGTLRRTDGSSGGLINCGSTGAIEEHLRSATEKRLAP